MTSLEDAAVTVTALGADGADAFGAAAFVPRAKYADYNQQGAWKPQAEAEAEAASLEWQLH